MEGHLQIRYRDTRVHILYSMISLETMDLSLLAVTSIKRG